MLWYLVILAFVPFLTQMQGELMCASGEEPFLQLTVVGCDEFPCNVYVGERAAMEIIFRAPRDIQSFSPRALAFILNIPIPYELPYETRDGCSHLLDGECPIPQGTVVRHILYMDVSPHYPGAQNLLVDISLHDENDVAIGCTRVTLHVIR
ncbi:NPC intracellular cholesterol transporter 2-like [Lutzomyia longipalpis]|uniref:NPC intracellular cholesterol transporter 2-like n=1 Tax=Lutzomyia longipalpis TaxID=7200 RepID=UPI0024844455|nr:NPC intracellular cholesterol transporter 2-like [Lutzomyia longipalpis]